VSTAVDAVGLAHAVAATALRRGLALLDHALTVFGLLAGERPGAVRQQQAAGGERAQPYDRVKAHDRVEACDGASAKALRVKPQACELPPHPIPSQRAQTTYTRLQPAVAKPLAATSPPC